MAAENILKSFMVRIGFSVSESQFRRFNEVMRSVGKNAIEVAKTTAAASVALGAGINAIGAQMESMYFASQRTGASVKELKEFSFAAEQIGLSAEQATGAIEGLATARRTNPGLNGLLRNYGINPAEIDNAKVLMQLLLRLRNMPHYQGAQVAGQFGINEATFNQLEQGLPEMEEALKRREKLFRQAGIDPDDMAARGHDFEKKWRYFSEELKTMAEIIAYRLMPVAERVMHWLERITDLFFKADGATGGWSSKLLGLAIALKGVVAARGLLGNLFGGGGAATLTTEAAEAGGIAATAEAGGVAAGIAWPLAIAAASVAALAWMDEHPEAVRKAAKTAWDWAKSEAGKAADAVYKAVTAPIDPKHRIDKAAQRGGLAPGSVAYHGGIDLVGGLLGFIKKAEGLRLEPYQDHKGESVGYGHLLKPWENHQTITKPDALNFLTKDITSALASVHELVKVRISKNQESALTDFVFNLGKGSLEKSTLLKNLNRGDYAGAAGEFAHWNKVMTNGHYLVDQGLVNRRAQESALFRTPDKPVTIHQETNINLAAGVDAESTARKIAGQQGRVNGDIVRNFATATR